MADPPRLILNGPVQQRWPPLHRATPPGRRSGQRGTDVLRAGRVPVNEIEKAWRVLAVDIMHQIPDIRLTRALIRLLNL